MRSGRVRVRGRIALSGGTGAAHAGTAGRGTDGGGLCAGGAGDRLGEWVWRSGGDSGSEWAQEHRDLGRRGGGRECDRGAGARGSEDAGTDGVACVSLAADGADAGRVRQVRGEDEVCQAADPADLECERRGAGEGGRDVLGEARAGGGAVPAMHGDDGGAGMHGNGGDRTWGDVIGAGAAVRGGGRQAVAAVAAARQGRLGEPVGESGTDVSGGLRGGLGGIRSALCAASPFPPHLSIPARTPL